MPRPLDSMRYIAKVKLDASYDMKRIRVARLVVESIYYRRFIQIVREIQLFDRALWMGGRVSDCQEESNQSNCRMSQSAHDDSYSYVKVHHGALTLDGERTGDIQRLMHLWSGS